MTRPVYKIETYTGAVLDHTITKSADNIYFKEIITDGIGGFSFTIPTKIGGSYKYNDIVLNDKVKIWMGYDTITGNPNFIGRVGAISAPLTVKGGFIRRISGLSQGEILLRRLNKDKYYTGTNASVIVDEWATDLGLGTGEITLETKQPVIEVKTKTYFDLMREISDHWINAGNQIKRDFYVNIDNELVWDARPLRTVGVESFSVGKEILFHNVTHYVDAVKNDIVVYGARERTEPSNPDYWTEPPPGDPCAGWTKTSCDTLVRDADQRMGTYCVKGTISTGSLSFYVSFSQLKDYNKLIFWCKPAAIAVTDKLVRILAPDTSNYFQATIQNFSSATYNSNELNLGPNQIFNADSNPNGVWTETGAPRWYNMRGVQFIFNSSSSPTWLQIDGGFCFTLGRYSGTASDGASKSSYEIRDLEKTDDKLHSDSECEQRAETLLFQLKDHPTQIKIKVHGNQNVLIGDQLSMTIPVEGISAANYDIINVEHTMSSKGDAKGYWTQATMVNSVNIRSNIPVDLKQQLRRFARGIRDLNLKETYIR